MYELLDPVCCGKCGNYSSTERIDNALDVRARHRDKNHADYIFQTDSDGQTDPAEFAAFWDARKEYDGIFSNRTVRGGREGQGLRRADRLQALKAVFRCGCPGRKCALPIDVMALLSRELIPIRENRQYNRLQTAHFRKPRYFIYRAA